MDSLYHFKGSKFAPTVVSGDGKYRTRVVESPSRFSSFEYNADLIVMSLLIASRAVILELLVAVLQSMN